MPMDTSAPTQKSETLRHRTHSAEMSWVRSVLGPKCRYTSACLVSPEAAEPENSFHVHNTECCIRVTFISPQQVHIVTANIIFYLNSSKNWDIHHDEHQQPSPYHGYDHGYDLVCLFFTGLKSRKGTWSQTGYRAASYLTSLPYFLHWICAILRFAGIIYLVVTNLVEIIWFFIFLYIQV